MIDIIVLGLEEGVVSNDFGDRTRMIAHALSIMPWVRQVIAVCSPISFPRRVVERVKGQKQLADIITFKDKVRGVTIYEVTPKLKLFSLETIIPETWRPLSSWDRPRIIRDVHKALKKQNIRQDVLWVSSPRAADLASLFSPQLLIFDCIDDMRQLTELKRFHAIFDSAYRWFDDHADIIFIASENQKSMFLQKQKIHLLQNGVNENFFKTEYEIPQELKDIKHPLVGYVGHIQNRLDIDLICNVVDRLPDFSFIFIGPVKIQEFARRLQRFSNVYLLGVKPYKEIPNYMKSLDVVMIPHKVNALTNSMDPLKIYEALASGKPIVSTPVAFPKKLGRFIKVTSEAETFAEYIRESIKPRSADTTTEQISVAKHYSWENRLNGIYMDIEQFINMNKSDDEDMIDIIILGLEEGVVSNDFGGRTRMLTHALTMMPWVRQVIAVCSPISFPRRVVERVKGQKQLADIITFKDKVGGVTIYEVTPKLKLFSLETIIPETWRPLSSWDRPRIIRDVHKALKKQNIRQDVLWVSSPRAADLASLFSPQLLIFDCIDDMRQLTELKRFHAIFDSAYRWFDDHADIIFIVSENQKSMFLQKQKIHLLQNGVNENFFKTEYEIPQELKDIKHPLVGYVGHIQNRLDIDLICNVVDRLPDFSFIFIGPVKIQEFARRLQRFSNVYLLGVKPYKEIPNYMKSLDVVMIPHKVNALTNSMDPLKIYEALASGKPIVSTPVAFPKELGRFIKVTSEAETFAEYIRESIKPRSADTTTEQISVAKHYSWENRLNGIYKDIQLRNA